MEGGGAKERGFGASGLCLLHCIQKCKRIFPSCQSDSDSLYALRKLEKIFVCFFLTTVESIAGSRGRLEENFGLNNFGRG